MRGLGFLGIGLVLLIIVGLLIGWPQYSVFAARKHGEAELARATQNRQVRVQEALAKFEAADYDAKAEVRRAQGVAAANKIIAESLGGPEGYLRWRYIEMLQETSEKGGHQIIYLPTEAGLPLLEAGRRPQPLTAPHKDD
ncbi:membrane protease subunit [Caulobacter soli]|uniref:membrane protease subunit n=1 Tax=Caulobacter soli TaxID=2708539 RepID=UPI0013EE1A52|nr:membrane protease subunit [Caulobacter soli]